MEGAASFAVVRRLAVFVADLVEDVVDAFLGWVNVELIDTVHLVAVVCEKIRIQWVAEFVSKCDLNRATVHCGLLGDQRVDVPGQVNSVVVDIKSGFGWERAR